MPIASDSTLRFDVLIVGAGLAGLSAALRLAQRPEKLDICVLEKAPNIGAHTVSGGILNPQTLDQLHPNWKNALKHPPQAVTSDEFWWMTPQKQCRLPVPPGLKNTGNYLVSISQLCQILAAEATAQGVTILTGIAAQTLHTQDNRVQGVQTGAMGLDMQGQPTQNTTPGTDIMAHTTWLAEGCGGHLSQEVIQRFQLSTVPQHYALGVREIWTAPSQPGKVIHTVGWPLSSSAYGGGFIYHYPNDQLAIGWVSGLENPHSDPHQCLQDFKTHPAIAPQLRAGKRMGYAARALNEGGWQALPQLNFPGGALLGCAAGMLDLASMKGMHHAIQSGMLAADHYDPNHPEMHNYDQAVRKGSIGQALLRARNLKPALNKGLYFGLAYGCIDQYLFKGKAPWTYPLHPPKTLELTAPPRHPKHSYDGTLTFNKSSSVYETQVFHREDQPPHLKIHTPDHTQTLHKGHPVMALCPAEVYTIDPTTQAFHLSAGNCIHCKACTLKDPQQITWVPPEGGQGPQFKDIDT